LERLVLDNSDITDSGVRNLAAMLTRNSSITSLSIQNNKIGTAGLEALLLMLGGEEGTLEPRNTTLREIRLDGNPAFPPATKFTDQWQEVCGVMTKVEEDIGSIEQREANRKLREKMELLMENHALGVMGDEKQLAADAEKLKSDQGLLEYLDQLKAQGETCIPSAVLMELSPEERDAVVDKALKCRVFEQQTLADQANSLVQEENAARSNSRSSTQLAAANQAQLQTASERVAMLKAELHAAMSDEEAILRQQLLVERDARAHSATEHELQRQRVEAELNKQWCEKSVQAISSTLPGQ